MFSEDWSIYEFGDFTNIPKSFGAHSSQIQQNPVGKAVLINNKFEIIQSS